MARGLVGNYFSFNHLLSIDFFVIFSSLSTKFEGRVKDSDFFLFSSHLPLFPLLFVLLTELLIWIEVVDVKVIVNSNLKQHCYNTLQKMYKLSYCLLNLPQYSMGSHS